MISPPLAATGGYLDVAEDPDMPAECAPTAGEVAVFNADATSTSPD